MFNQLCYRNYHRQSCKQASAVSQNYHYFRHSTEPDNEVLTFFRIRDKTSARLTRLLRVAGESS